MAKEKGYVVIVAGSRSIKSKDTVFRSIEEFRQDVGEIREVVCGMAEGVDLLGRDWALDNDVSVKDMPVLKSEAWVGGPCQRNQRMADYAQSQMNGALLLVWDGVSSGSADMLRRARKAGLYIMIVDMSQPRLL